MVPGECYISFLSTAPKKEEIPLLDISSLPVLMVVSQGFRLRCLQGRRQRRDPSLQESCLQQSTDYSVSLEDSTYNNSTIGAVFGCPYDEIGLALDNFRNFSVVLSVHASFRLTGS